MGRKEGRMGEEEGRREWEGGRERERELLCYYFTLIVAMKVTKQIMCHLELKISDAFMSGVNAMHLV